MLIREERNRFGSPANFYEAVAKKAGRGRRPDTGRLLVDLAIIRAKHAGFSRRGTIELLRPLLRKFQFIGNKPEETEGLFSEKNWPTTLKKAGKHLALPPLR
jgi:hypothetical protein